MKLLIKYTSSILLSILVLVITGCSGDKVNMDEEFPPSMPGFIMVDDTEYEMAQGNYRWEKKEGFSTHVARTDAASPNQIAENVEAIKIPPNTKLTIIVEEKPALTLYQWNEDGGKKAMTLTDHSFSVPTEEGRYIYEVLAEWKNGEVSYTIVVEVE
ncbi:hypothetical protein [Sutcliffiella deserti]|uniref:hypothetical protein n=1 Tax=Sutcliffiella deserti TaxID=2875501 RepID=UPI001CBDBDF1|nr:hypothetical protein [Sutcliffiella deserti]